jgi:hypothetical protein
LLLAIFLSGIAPLHAQLFNQLRILASEDFPDFGFFQDLIEPNQHINYALRRLDRQR